MGYYDDASVLRPSSGRIDTNSNEEFHLQFCVKIKVSELLKSKNNHKHVFSVHTYLNSDTGFII